MPAVSLIGRDRQQEICRDIALRAVSGAGGVLVVRGDPGIGKSTLVAAALSEVAATIVVGQAVPGAARPGRPLAEIVVAAVAMGASMGDPALGLFHRPLLALIDKDPTIPEAGGDIAAFGPYPATLGEGLLRLLTRAAPHPVAVVEDLQWADPDTLAVVEYIAGHINGRAMALVITHRPGENVDADAVIGRLGRHSWANCLDLAALPPDAVHEMIRVRLQGGRPPTELVADVAGFAEGVPLLVDEFLTAALEDNSLRPDGDGDWQYTAARRPHPPESLRDSVEARVGRLGRIGRRTLLAGALLGRTFDVGVVARGLHLDVPTVAEAVRVASRADLIRFGPGPDQAEFRHALIRDAIDAMLGPPERVMVARQLLAALPAQGGHTAEAWVDVAATLAQDGGYPDLAARHYLRAGRDAIDRGAVHSGAALIERAAAVAVDAELAVNARIALVDARALTGHVDQALREGQEVLALLADDAPTIPRVHLSMARAAVAGQLWSVAAHHLTVAGAAADPGVVLALRAVVALGAGQPGQAVDFASRAAAHAEQVGPPHVVCEAYEILGRVAREHDLDEAAAWFKRAVDAAERSALALWRARALHELATVSQLRDLELDDLHRARQAALEVGAAGLLTAVDFHIAAIHGVRFEPEPALTAARRCLAEARRIGASRQQAWGWILIGQAHACAGRRAQAAAAADEAERIAPADAEIAGLAWGTCRGLASLLAGDRDQAVQQYRAGIAHLRPLHRIPLPPWYLWPLIALVWTNDEGETAVAEANDSALLVATGPAALWHLAAAVAAGRAGRTEDAQDHHRHAETRFQAVSGFVGYRHLGYRLAAEAAITDGWGQPGEWLTDAEQWFTGKHFDAIAASCRALQRRAGVRQRRRGRGATPVPAGLAGLGVTTREADVLTLVAAGLTNLQIADRLYISHRTVKSHLEALLRKTGSTGRTQLATLAVAHGLADTATPNR